jgi:predicted phage tail protein
VTTALGDVHSWGKSGPYSFRFAVKLRNSAGVLPQLDITTVGHLLGAFLRRVVVDALEVDSFNVMAVTGDKIRAIV